jgi:ATP-dependent Clp protease ATP-binding subunit ClpB
VLFNPLGQEQLNKIVDLELAKVMRLLAGRNVRIELTPAARERVVHDGYDPAYGARPLRRTVQRLVQDPLAMRILDGSVLPGDLVRVDIDPETDSMRFDRVVAKAAQAPAAEAQAAASASPAAKSSRRK